MARFNLAAIPQSVQTDLCVVAIIQTAAALATPEGKAAIEKHMQDYLHHLAEKEKSAGASGARKEET